MAKPIAKRVLLIGWDAADWKILSPLIDSGQMPAFAQLVEAGCVGNIASLRPPLSPILWTSIVTGKRAYKHGIRGFVEPTTDGVGMRPITSTARSTKALWNICHQAGMNTHAVGFFALHPAEPIRGVCVSDQFAIPPKDAAFEWPLPAGSVHPEKRGADIAKLRVRPEEISNEDLRQFIPRIAEIDRGKDRRPWHLAAAIAKAASVQAVLIGVLQNEPWDFTAAYFDAIDVVSHHFMPFHPPKMAQVSNHDFELYKDVMIETYKFHDTMLGHALQLIDDQTAVIVVSDHGFHSDHLRPTSPPDTEEDGDDAKDAAWHRPLGVICLAGPGIRKDERIYGATLLDVTPTILSLYGLPVGKDMDGKVLAQAFEKPVEIERIDSWDAVEGDAGRHPVGTEQTGFGAAESMQHLVDLGYIEPLSNDAEKNFERAVTEGDYNLAVSYLDGGRPAEAIKQLEKLLAAEPDSIRFASLKAHCLHLLGRAQEASELIELLLTRNVAVPDADLMLAAARFNTSRHDEALALLEKAIERNPQDIRPHTMKAGAMLVLRRWADAEASYRMALEIDESNPEVLDGLSQALIGQNRPEEAAEAALAAVGFIHFFPQAHLHLGVALVQMGEHQRAIGPFELAVSMQPNLLEAHQYLASIHRKLGNWDLAGVHRQAAEALIARHAGEQGNKPLPGASAGA